MKKEILKKEILKEVKLLNSNLLFADGVSRTGKAMLSSILLGFENISNINFFYQLEQLLPMYAHGHMSKNAISSYLRLHLNELVYNTQISRNINFRPSDLTSVLNTANSRDYYINLMKLDGDEIIKNIDGNATILQFQTHNILTEFKLFHSLELNIKLIELFRDPIDTVYSWYKRGWGKRFDNEDPRSFTTLFSYKDKTIPHYVIGQEDEYFSLNEVEKTIFMHNHLIKKSIAEYNQLNKLEKENILLITYENILQNTNLEIKRISQFIKKSPSYYMPKAMELARVPRQVKFKEKRLEKFNEIKNLTTKKYLIDELLNLSKEYNNNLYGLKII